jgi:hypothetical protein
VQGEESGAAGTDAGKIWGRGERGRGGDCGLGAGRGERGGGLLRCRVEPWWTPSLRPYRVVYIYIYIYIYSPSITGALGFGY